MQSKPAAALVVIAVASFIIAIICAVKADGETGYLGDLEAAANFAAASNVFLIWAGTCVIAVLVVAAIDHSLARITVRIIPDQRNSGVLPPVVPRTGAGDPSA